MAKAGRMRLDERLVAEGLVESRSLAQRVIMAGKVRVDGQRKDKASQLVTPDQVVALDAPPRFVSRAGDKLANALDDTSELRASLGMTVDGAVVLDIGASTGGFTDCMLQNGASSVIAVDVGYGQIHERLRTDERVHVMERVNARSLEPDMLPAVPDVLVCDASFIGLATVIPAPLACMAPGWWGMLLCKPQFEAGRERVGKGGIVRDADVRQAVIEETCARLAALGIDVVSRSDARPAGAGGNVEAVLLVRAAAAR